MVTAKAVIKNVPGLDECDSYIEPRQVIGDFLYQETTPRTKQLAQSLERREQVSGCMQYVRCDDYIDGQIGKALLSGLSLQIQQFIADEFERYELLGSLG